MTSIARRHRSTATHERPQYPSTRVAQQIKPFCKRLTMSEHRREWILRSAAQLAALGAGAMAGASASADEQAAGTGKPATPPDGKAWRIGVISARIKGKPQRVNGHTWHFAQYLHPTIELKTAQKYLDPGNQKYFE